jgi:hypothetical protein
MGPRLGLALVVLSALLAGSSLLEPGYYDSHDGLLNVHRLFELEGCLADGQLPCRWVAHMGAGYGYPLFNFYPPLPTYIAAGLRALGAGSLDAVKWTMLLALVLGAASMFGLARSFFGVAGGVLAAILYTFAPYQAVDVFVRGALAETWGLALLPLVFWTGQRSVSAPGKAMRWGLLCAFAWTALLLSHGITALMASLPYLVWIGFWLSSAPRDTRGRALLATALAHGLGLALAAWFFLPSLLELRHVHAETLTSLYPWARYENNFLTMGELILATSGWGYGPFRAENGMSLFLGPVHVVAGVGVLTGLGVIVARGRRLDRRDLAALLLGVAGLAAAFMTLSVSRPIWDVAPPLAFLQFPWRFLSIATLGFSFAAGWIALRLKGRAWAPVLASTVLCAAAITLGWSWFQPSAMHRVRDEVLANEREIAKARHGLFDFLPRQVDLESFLADPPRTSPPPAEAVSSAVVLRDMSRASDRVDFEAQILGTDIQLVTLNLYEFPGWTLTVDDEPTSFAPVDDPLGRLHVRLPPGRHQVVARFENTPVRSFANGVSAMATLAAIGWILAIVRSERTRQ